jgi:RNA polymerase sigma-70 factor (ECF subfamily)
MGTSGRVTPEHLLKHGPFLRALARQLVGDAARADDVVQEAWLAALEHAPARALRPWLVGVVRNLARRVRREEARRTRREKAVAKRDVDRPTADVVAGEAARRDVVEAVLQLREPYRTAILLRYYDDLSAREIATRLGVNASTVRSRVSRGLEELRGLLDRRHRGDRREWCLAVLPLALQPTRIKSALLTGGLVMESKFLAIGAAIAVGVCVLLVWRASDDAARERSGPAANAPGASATSKAEQGAGAESASGQQVGTAARTSPVLLPGVVRLGDGAQGEAVEIEVEGERSGGDRFGRVAAAIESGRGFRVDVGALFAADPFPVALQVRARHPEHMEATMRLPVTLNPRDGAPRLERFEITLQRAGIVWGSVRDARGAVAAAVVIAAFPLANGVPGETAVAKATTSEDGRFQLDVDCGGGYLVVALTPAHRPAWAVFDIAVGKVLELPPLTLRAGESVEGRVVLTGGTPGPDAVLEARRVAGGGQLLEVDSTTRLLWTSESVEWGTVSVTADPEGRYRIGGLVAAEYRVAVKGLKQGHYGLFASRDGRRYEREVAAPAAGVDFEVAATTLDVLARDAGEPVEGVRVMITDVRENSTYGWFFETGADGRARCLVRPDATCVLELGVPRPEVHVEVGPYAPIKRTVASPAAGCVREVVLDVERRAQRATLVVTVSPDADVALPAEYRFELRPAAGGATTRHHASAERGRRFVVRELDAGSYHLVARAGNGDAREERYYRRVEAPVELVAGAETRLELRPEAGGRLQILTVTPEGRTGVGAICWLETVRGERVDVSFAKYAHFGSTISRGRLPMTSGPAFVVEVLEPGPYRLHLVHEDYRPVGRELRVEAGRTTGLKIDLERRR